MCAVQETPQGRIMGYGVSDFLPLPMPQLTTFPAPHSNRQGRGLRRRATRARHRAERRARVPPARALAQVHVLARAGVGREPARALRRPLRALREYRRDHDVRGLRVQRVPPREGVLQQPRARAQSKG